MSESGRPIAFRVESNGQHVCVAGLHGSNGVLTVIVHSALRPETQELVLDVGGLDSSSAEHMTWERRELLVGDEIRIIIEENADTTRPTTAPQWVEQRSRKLSSLQSGKLPRSSATNWSNVPVVDIRIPPPTCC